MNSQEQLDRLTGIVAALPSRVVHHDDQIGNLITIAEKHREEMAELRQSMVELRRSMAETDRLFQADPETSASSVTRMR